MHKSPESQTHEAINQSRLSICHIGLMWLPNPGSFIKCVFRHFYRCLPFLLKYYQTETEGVSLCPRPTSSPSVGVLMRSQGSAVSSVKWSGSQIQKKDATSNSLWASCSHCSHNASFNTVVQVLTARIKCLFIVTLVNKHFTRQTCFPFALLHLKHWILLCVYL